MDYFAKIISEESSILDVQQGFEYASLMWETVVHKCSKKKLLEVWFLISIKSV